MYTRKMKQFKLMLLMGLLFSLGMQLRAEVKPTFVAEAVPEAVVKGDQIRLKFTTNSKKIRNFRPPIIRNFQVLMGPSRSSFTNTQYIQNKMTTQTSITYTYIMLAQKEGKFTIPPATIEIDGKEVKSNAVTIKVLPPDEDASTGKAVVSSQTSSSKTVNAKNLFARAIVNKTKVYNQEAILLTYKVYTTLDLRNCALIKAPDFKDFQSKEIELPRSKTFSMERYKGKNYKTVVLYQYLLFPQRSGSLKIPQAIFESSIAQRIQSEDPFDSFFNGGVAYTQIKKKIKTPELKIKVLPFPENVTDNFKNAVGHFQISSTISTKQLKTNEALTLKIVLSGTGNMKLIEAPVIKFPSDFEIYDPKINDKYTVTSKGFSGTKEYEYLIVPRHAGEYTIPAAEFTYFDLKTKKYVTIRTTPYNIKVAKGAQVDPVVSNYVNSNKEDVKMLGKDIRYIMQGEVALEDYNSYNFGSLSYILWYTLPALLFVLCLVVYRQQMKENANLSKVRTKKANKVATKRMKSAEKLMKQHQKEAFYDEVMRALWGYVGDKLNMPVSELSKDNVTARLSELQILEETITEFIKALDECEFARYAPGNKDEAMNRVYTTAIAVISEMENQIKRS
jgi:hypothetical protein